MKADNNKEQYSTEKVIPAEVKGMENPALEQSEEDLKKENNVQSMSVNYENLNEDPSISDSRLLKYIKKFKLPPLIFRLFMITFMPVSIWLLSYVLFKEDNLPGGSVFVIIVLEFGGRILGYAAQLIKLPPMLGMLGLGIMIRNIPNFDFGKHLDPALSAPIRQIALAIILIRAGLGLDLDVLLRRKGLIFRLAFFPTIIEASIVAILTHFLIDFPWIWGLLVGFVISAVSPAVIVPRLLYLRDEGYGIDKGIPTTILAAASLDNIVAIALFGVTLGFAFSDNKSLVQTILQGPLEIIYGLLYGIIWGSFHGILYSRSQKDENNVIAIRALLTFVSGVISVIGFYKLGFSGAGALGCLISSFLSSCIWQQRGVRTKTKEPLVWIFFVLWFIFEPLLFGVIGCQIDITTLHKDTVLYGLICISVGLIVRFIVTFIMSMLTDLNVKEKIFCAICWIPKATVQAAIGPIALDTAVNLGKQDEENLGQKVLSLAVLAILVTAPLGELGVILFGPRLLVKDNETTENYEMP